MKAMASFTVRIFSAASSGISTPNSSSKAMTSSTVSRLSAPRSSMKLASSVTFSASTPRCSTTIFFTRSATSLILITPSGIRSETCVRHAIAAPPGPCKPGSMQGPPPSGSARLGHVHPAVHMHRLAGDVGAFVAGEPDEGGGHVLAVAEAARGDALEHLGLLRLGERVRHRGADEARGDAVHGHVARGDFGGEAAGHPLEPG